MRIRIFTDHPGQGETGHAHLSNTRQLSSIERSAISRYSAAQKKVRELYQKITIFLVFMNKTQILLFALVPSDVKLGALVHTPDPQGVELADDVHLPLPTAASSS